MPETTAQMPKGTGLAPYITVNGAAEAIEFYKRAFGAEEHFRLEDPDSGRIGHAELSVSGQLLMVSDEYPDFGALSPDSLGGSPVKLHLYVADVDAVFARALAAGGTELRAVKDEFYGDRTGTLSDPFGHTWMLASHREEVSPAEMQTRWQEMMGG
jgi:PhnB protein